MFTEFHCQDDLRKVCGTLKIFGNRRLLSVKSARLRRATTHDYFSKKLRSWTYLTCDLTARNAEAVSIGDSNRPRSGEELAETTLL
jgi:hypothetical protein